MILTITPNPSLDYLFETETLVWDDANRVEMPRRRPGGQGINLTRAARVLGSESVALACFGGSTGRELRELLDAESTPYIAVDIEAETRIFCGVRETASGRSLLINPRGPRLSERDRDRIITAVNDACEKLKPEWIVCAGSIPRGLGDDLYAEIAGIAKTRRMKFIADCDGEPLARATRAGCSLLAPNQHEAERLARMPISTHADAAAAARALISVSPQVFLKLGASGAVACNASGTWLAFGPRLARGSAVGAGDASLAAVLASLQSGAALEQALRCAVAAGTAVLHSRGTDLITRADFEAVLVTVQLQRLN